MQSESLPEPWLRGILPNLHPVVAHLFRASEQIREDAGKALASLTPEQIWARPFGMTSAGFHAKHLAGSTQRLCTYLEGHRLDSGALEEMSGESMGSESASKLHARIQQAFSRYVEVVLALPPDQFDSVREVGRRRIEVTAISLAIHIAEHGQRHTGQLISAGRLGTALKVDKI